MNKLTMLVLGLVIGLGAFAFYEWYMRSEADKALAFNGIAGPGPGPVMSPQATLVVRPRGQALITQQTPTLELFT